MNKIQAKGKPEEVAVKAKPVALVKPANHLEKIHTSDITSH